jgi:signal transduction histidine kinase
VQAQDEERQRLERNLHDGAQQQLIALAIQLSLLEDAAANPGEVKGITGQLRSGLQAALDDLRALARGIYPPLLADQGLAAALRAQATKTPVPVSIEAGGIGRYPRDAAEGHLTFTITDDGAGLDTATTTHGTGLQGMADRLAALGGTLQIRSKPGLGTTVTGSLPVSELAQPHPASAPATCR